jgi:hypothetical protein
MLAAGRVRPLHTAAAANQTFDSPAYEDLRMKQKFAIAASIVSMIVVAAIVSGDQSPKPRAETTKVATGIVFDDANNNLLFDEGEKPLPGVRVSNGRDIVRTGDDGRYRLTVSDDTIVFVIKPRNWRTPLDENKLPQFYYNHKPKGSPKLKYPGVSPTGALPKSVDFPMYAQQEPEVFRAILFGDPQPRNQKEIDYIAHDVIEELVGTDASFGVTLGDIMFDDLSLFPSLSRSIALLGIPWYNVIGNHDINTDATHDRFSDETFERAFGPSYYSFDYGQVHFLVLDDVEWTVSEKSGKGGYRGGLGERQMEFIRNDLAMIPEEQVVVLLMHIPLVDVRDRHELYRLIEQRPFCLSVSGHTHHHEHRFITNKDGWKGPKPHHHIINVTVSGSWWSGAPDERGIPHTMMADGAPNGYSIITFDGSKYHLDYKVAGRPSSYQMSIFAPEQVTATDAETTDVFVNVFNGSEKSKVEMKLGKQGTWQTMQRQVKSDPALVRLYEYEKAIKDKPWRGMSKPKPSTHLWHANLPSNPSAGTHFITIRETDMFGRTHVGRRIIRVLPNPN